MSSGEEVCYVIQFGWLSTTTLASRMGCLSGPGIQGAWEGTSRTLSENHMSAGFDLPSTCRNCVKQFSRARSSVTALAILPMSGELLLLAG